MYKTNSFRNLLIILVLVLSIPVGVYLSLRKTSFWGKAFGVPANLVIDVGSSFNVPGGVWKNLAQGGEENARMLAPVVGKVKAVNPEYIRIDHVFDYYDTVSKDFSGKLAFNWAKLDLTISDILAVGARPFISLSYTPPVISSGNVTDLPTNWGDWETSVQSLVEHVSGKGGLNISGVYYEVWNEPDLFGRFKFSGEKDYRDLYFHSVVGANKAQGVNAFKIGGPATTGLYENWVKGLLKFTAESGLRLDFISWHSYAKDLNKYEDDLVKSRTWLAEFPERKNIELIISEIGINSENDKGYDGGFSAIQTIATATLFETEISRMFTFEIKDGPGPEKFWGRWGILTHEKWGEPEVKPRYYALTFLNQMMGNKINIAGEGSWVKAFGKEEGGVYRLLVVNYDPQGKHYETVPMNFINIPYKSFSFKRKNFTGEVKEQKVVIEGTGWQTTEGFDANSAAIFTISPI